MTKTTHEFDVVVVGHGIAGMSAAVSAMEHGARVAVLERAPADESGGCTRYTEAFLRMKSEDELSDDFEAIMAECGSANPDPNIVKALSEPPSQWTGRVRATGITDPEYIATFAREAVPAVRWLKGMGVRFFPTRLPHISCRNEMPMICPSGGGFAMIEALLAAAHKGGVQFFYDTTARALIQDESNNVVGVRALGKSNRPVEFSSRAVILANGGFEGSPEMLARYVGANAVSIRPVAPGCHYNRGDGIRMAVEAGAAMSGDYGTYHGTSVDERSGRQEAKVLIFPYGIVVNKDGRRFVDEAPGGGYDAFDRMCYAIQSQIDGIGYTIVDSKINDIPDYQKSIFTDKPPIEAATIPELAALLKVPARTLAESIASFNAGCRPGPFNPYAADGLATTGVQPPKSNWARPLDKGPYIAYPLVPSSIITLGGIKTDSAAHVLNVNGDRIPGLFAAGALVGVYYRRYVAATSVLRGATFGRLAGKQAAAEVAR